MDNHGRELAETARQRPSETYTRRKLILDYRTIMRAKVKGMTRPDLEEAAFAYFIVAVKGLTIEALCLAYNRAVSAAVIEGWAENIDHD